MNELEGYARPRRMLTVMSEPVSDLSLLRREAGLLWGADRHGRHDRPPLVILADSGTELWLNVSDQLANAPPDRWRTALMAGGPGAPPPGLRSIKEELDHSTPSILTSCVSYLLDPVRQCAVPSGLTVHDSDRPVSAHLLHARPEQTWQPLEWQDLLESRLGPWAMAIHDGEVVALCHTPRDSGHEAEAGVWTHPDHRGRGYAAVVVARWAGIAARDRDALFYSHLDDNVASRSVAVKLRARPIGRIWQLHLGAQPVSSPISNSLS
ncbi:MAG TPA: GNAT family N-acetyltransferase [Beutenbergiaceae bacterium]|nr:GNAT family N-acetyltransferase [Beutenbergiaceae bacterium]